MYNRISIRREKSRFSLQKIYERIVDMEKEYKMSAARAQELQEELNYLKTTRSDEVADQDRPWFW